MKKNKIFLLICGVLAASLALSALIIFAANDALALDKSGDEVTLVLTDRTDVGALSKKLDDAGIIDMPHVFGIYSALRRKTSFEAGEYTLSRSMSYDEIYIALSGTREREQIKITIPEGMTTDRIISIFTDAGIGTREGFIDALSNDYGYDYIPQKPDDRTYRYDGYLFPDTYFFYSDSSERDVISKMLKNFDLKFGKNAAPDVDIDKCVTIASIIQREAYFTAEMGALSSVLHNRLSSSTLRRLECDSTVGYAWQTGKFEGDFLTADSPYNTYLYEGLPPGAICSPGLSALNAAANPKKTDYYYFFSKQDKTFVFSKTHAQHLYQRKKYGV